MFYLLVILHWKKDFGICCPVMHSLSLAISTSSYSYEVDVTITILMMVAKNAFV